MHSYLRTVGFSKVKSRKEMQEIIQETAEGNGQCWLMIDVEDEGSVYQDIWKLLALRAGCYDVAESE
mgnify:CR=1 FL=1